jgi:CrcB protein
VGSRGDEPPESVGDAKPRFRAKKRGVSSPAALLVALGGALGALGRYAVDLAVQTQGIALPWATLAVNLLGCLLMGFLVSYVLAHPARHPLWRPFLGIGVLGGFTTFSAFAGDAVVLLETGAWGWAAAYVTATLVGGLLVLRGSVAAGTALRRRRAAA